MSYSHLTGSYLILTLNKFCILSAYQVLAYPNKFPKTIYIYHIKKSNVVFLQRSVF